MTLQLLTFGEVANELGVPLKVVEFIAAEGLAPYHRLGWGKERIDKRELEEWREVVQCLAELPPRKFPTKAPETGLVYFIQAEQGGPIKIGTARDPERRLAELQNLCPFRLKLLAVEPGGMRREYELHNRFHFWRLHGEWFRENCTELQAAIRTARKEWGTPRKNRISRRARKFVRTTCGPAEEAA